MATPSNENMVFISGGRSFKIESSQSSLQFERVTKAGKKSFDITIKLSLSTEECDGALIYQDNLTDEAKQDITIVDNLTFIAGNRIVGKDNVEATIASGSTLHFTSVPFGSIGAHESGVSLNLNLGFEGGGKTSNGKTSNG
jgi:hypothetical protein